MSGSNSSVPAADKLVDQGLTLTVHSLPDPRSMADSQRTLRGRLWMLLVVLACAAPVVASYLTFYVFKPQGKAYGELIHPPIELPTLQLQDLKGQGVPAESLKGQWMLTLVQEQACDSACEHRLYTQRQLREMLGKERDKVDKLLLLPQDAPEPSAALREALAQGVGVTVLRLPREQLQAWLKPAAGQGLQDHFFLMDPMGRWMLRAPSNPEPSKLKRDLSRLLKASASWDQPGR